MATALKIAALFFFPASIAITQAAFDLNWQRDEPGYVNNDAYVSCNMSYISNANCSSGGFGGDFDLSGAHDDGTAFFQQQFSTGGQQYFHVIVGDYTRDPFAQEVIIKANAANNYWNGGFGGSGNIAVSHARSNNSDPNFNTVKPYDPDSSRTGTGSGNPNSVLIRQIANSGEIQSEFLKDSFTQKPRISQTITGSGANAGIVSTMVIDMRSLNYSSMTPLDASTMITNTVVLSGPLINGTSGNFNNATDAQSNYNTGGGFTYTAGSGPGGSGGNYTYMDPLDDANPIFEPNGLNWVGYCKPSENPNWGNGPCLGGNSGGGGGWGW